jgi:hypothetical protein
MIPTELTAYPQWVLWREVVQQDGTRTKLPYSCKGRLASTSDPSTWTTYQQATDTAQRLLMGVGFVLSENDPFAFIDLDDPYKNHPPPEEAARIVARHLKIVNAFDSYTEVSPSGTGLHIIVKGAVETGKRRTRNQVEVYSSGRYMTVTGQTYRDSPIQDRSDLLRVLWEECGGSVNGNGHKEVKEETDERHSDEQIFTQAKEAANGEKFLALWQGQWMDAGYKSQSEADFALINILSFYSRNVTQIKRLFFLSGLGQRDKAKRKTYVDQMVKRSFDNAPVYLPLEELTTNLLEELKQKVKFIEPVTNPFAGPLFQNVTDENPQHDWTMPPGLLGEIADFIYRSSPRPVKEIALATSIGLLAGICGRAYNVSATGLNQYVLLLAGTGTGKEAMHAGISKLMRYVKLKCPAALDFIGPSEIASGQALVKQLSRTPCFVSIVGEFGLMLQSLCAYNANASQIMLRKKLLELYQMSGEKDVMQPTIYSDKANNTQIVHSPSFTLLGESTPESYYAGLDETMILQGLLPRFTCIEYLGPRPDLNRGHASVNPSEELVTKIGEIAANCLMMAQNNRVLTVRLDEEATKFEKDFDKQTTTNINKSEIEVARQLWNRAHLKMLKLAALIALGINPYEPLVTLECVQWAHILVERDIQNVFKRFESGTVGKETSELHQAQEIHSIVKDYLMRPFDQTMQRYQVDSRMHQDRVIPLSYLQRRLGLKTAFRQDRMGATIAIKRAVETMITDGALQEVRQIDSKSRYGKTAKVYVVTDLSRFIA